MTDVSYQNSMFCLYIYQNWVVILLRASSKQKFKYISSKNLLSWIIVFLLLFIVEVDMIKGMGLGWKILKVKILLNKIIFKSHYQYYRSGLLLTILEVLKYESFWAFMQILNGQNGLRVTWKPKWMSITSLCTNKIQM